METRRRKSASDFVQFGKPAALSVYPFFKVRKNSLVLKMKYGNPKTRKHMLFQ